MKNIIISFVGFLTLFCLCAELHAEGRIKSVPLDHIYCTTVGERNFTFGSYAIEIADAVGGSRPQTIAYIDWTVPDAIVELLGGGLTVFSWNGSILKVYINGTIQSLSSQKIYRFNGELRLSAIGGGDYVHVFYEDNGRPYNKTGQLQCNYDKPLDNIEFK